MEDCFNCGISKESSELIEVISQEGIVKLCKECAQKEKLPFVKKFSQIKENLIKADTQESKSVYERLSKMSGVKFEKEQENKEIKKQDDSLNWNIMRARRRKHLTQEQLAKELSEPEIAIKTIEKGITSRGVYELVDKIEKYLGIKITTKKISEKQKIAFDPITTKSLTIEDLKEMQNKEKEALENENIFDEEIKEIKENEFIYDNKY
ncbi:MAG: hypothetical protein P8X70_02825 [Nanoarchaeota archaeon]